MHYRGDFPFFVWQRKSQIRKFADLQKLLHLSTLRKCDKMRIGNLWTQAFMRFADLQYADQIFFAEIELPKNT